MIPKTHIKSLISTDTSRQNKLWLVESWKHFHNWFIEWKWQGEPYNSRLMFRFSETEDFIVAKSFDEDILPTYEFDDKRKSKKQKTTLKLDSYGFRVHTTDELENNGLIIGVQSDTCNVATLWMS
jgi:hypothetical protein